MKHFDLPTKSMLVLTVLSSSALGQTPPGGGYQVNPAKVNTIPHAAGLSTFGRALFGPIAGDFIPGAAVSIDGDVYGIFDPAVHKSLFPIEEDVNDFGLVAAVGDGPAGVVLALADGLWLYELDTDPSTPDFVQTLLDDDPDYQDLDMVRVGDLDGQGRQDLMLVDGSVVRLLIDSGSGWVAAGYFDVGSTPRDLVAIDWDSNSSTDAHIAVLLDQSVEVWAPSSTSPPYDLEEWFTGSAVGGHLAALPATSSYPSPRLAYATPVTGVGDYLVVLAPGGGRVNCGAFSSTAGDLRSLVSAELSGSGATRVDLLTTVLGQTQAGLFHQRNISPPYLLPNPQTVLGTGAVVSAYDGAPAFGDFTFDRVPDALVGSAINDEFYCFLGQPAALAEDVTGLDAWADPELVQGSQAVMFGITVDVPASNPYGYDYWQLLLWKSDDGTELQRQAIANHKYDLGTGATQDLWMSLEVGLQETACLFDEAYYISLRRIKLNGDTIQLASGGIHAGFALDYTTAANMNPNDYDTQTILLPLSCGEPGGPGFVPLPDLPPIVDGLPPMIGPITPGPGGPM